MPDLSPRRRLAGRALLGAGLLAIPLTATVSYAASEAVLEAPEPPAPPAAPDAPEAPAAPTPPKPGAPHVTIVESRTGEVTTDGGDDGADVTERVWRDADGKEHRMKIIMRGAPAHLAVHDREAMKKRFEALRSGTKAEREAAIAAMRADMEAFHARGDVMMMVRRPLPPGTAPSAPGSPQTSQLAGVIMPPVVVVAGCKPGSSEIVDSVEGKDGQQKIMICHSRIAAAPRAQHETARAGLAEARAGLEAARAEIAGSKDIPEATRKQVLDTLDAQIDALAQRAK